MSNLPQLTETQVRRWTGEASFARGQNYLSVTKIQQKPFPVKLGRS